MLVQISFQNENGRSEFPKLTPQREISEQTTYESANEILRSTRNALYKLHSFVLINFPIRLCYFLPNFIRGPLEETKREPVFRKSPRLLIFTNAKALDFAIQTLIYSACLFWNENKSGEVRELYLHLHRFLWFLGR